MTLNAARRFGWRGVVGASALVCLLTETPSQADEHQHTSAEASAMQAHLDAKTAPVAQRLWADLVCLCGRCPRLTLAACQCPDAAAERKKVVELLQGHDLSSAAGSHAAYQAVVQAYVTRFGGRQVLASEGTGSADGSGAPWVLLVGLIAALGAGFVVIEVARKRRGRSRGRSRARRGH